MTDPQVRLGCLELAAQLSKAQNNYSADAVVETAKVLYNFTQAPQQEETPAVPADKPKQKKAATKVADILS
jgi:hypothetical protein